MAIRSKKSIAASIDTLFYHQKNKTPFSEFPTKEVNVTDVSEQREKLKNQAFEQDITLKRNTLIVLFLFLGFETIAIFVFSYFQGISFAHFHLEEWSFKLLVSATLLQITYMVKIAVQHLFPQK